MSHDEIQAALERARRARQHAELVCDLALERLLHTTTSAATHNTPPVSEATAAQLRATLGTPTAGTRSSPRRSTRQHRVGHLTGRLNYKRGGHRRS